MDDNPLHIEYDGSVRDLARNPVYDLLTKHGKMTENEIVNDIRSWWFNVDGKKLFEQARASGLIVSSPRSLPGMPSHWKLAI